MAAAHRNGGKPLLAVGWSLSGIAGPCFWSVYFYLLRLLLHFRRYPGKFDEKKSTVSLAFFFTDFKRLEPAPTKVVKRG